MALSEGESALLPTCNRVPLAGRGGVKKTNESARGHADQRLSCSPAISLRRSPCPQGTSERVRARATERRGGGNEAAPIQSQHHRHKSWFCTISSRLS